MEEEYLWICATTMYWNDKELTGISEVYTIAISTDTEHDKRLVTAQELIQSQSEDSYCRRDSNTFGLTGAIFNYKKMGIWFVQRPLTGQVRKSFLSRHTHVLSVTLMFRDWQDTRVKGLSTSQCDSNTTGYIWKMTFTWLWEIFANALKICRQNGNDAPYKYPSKWQI